jgi:hypothetical protein
VTDTRKDKPVTPLATRVTNQDEVVVLDVTAVVWRDPTVADAVAGEAAGSAIGRLLS